MNTSIKKYNIAQIDDLIHAREKVLREVFDIDSGENIDALLEANREYYLKAFKEDAHVAYVYLEGETAIGCGDMCIQREMPSPDNPSGKCGLLMNIYTCPEYRKQGVGKKIVEALIEEAKIRGIKKLVLESSTAGRVLYSECGFIAFKDCMIKYL